MKTMNQKFWMSLALAVSAVVGLSGCAPVMIGGAVMGGLVATDRRTPGIQLEDETIELRSARFIRENFGERVHVNITSYNRQVLLTGEVPSLQDKKAVELVVSRVENLRTIVNELVVAPVSTLSQRSSDALITGKARASMVDTKDLFANAFKLVTERSTIYLMGRVTKREADRATEIARSTGNVQKVVRLFEILTEDELKGLIPPPAKSDARK
ncbi:MAG: BON domain-containing protein [Burkholderiaceae bacterium]